MEQQSLWEIWQNFPNPSDWDAPTRLKHRPDHSQSPVTSFERCRILKGWFQIPSGHQVTFRILSSLRGEIPWMWEFTRSTAVYKFPMGEGHCWTPEVMEVKECVSMRKLIRCLQKKDHFRKADLMSVNATVVTDWATLPADLSPWCIYVLVTFITGNSHCTDRSWLSPSVCSRGKPGVTIGHRLKSVWVRKETESLPLKVPWQGWVSKLVVSA